jgi:hypothetical protein
VGFIQGDPGDRAQAKSKDVNHMGAGKRLRGAVYVHVAGLDDLSSSARSLVASAGALAGVGSNAD